MAVDDRGEAVTDGVAPKPGARTKAKVSPARNVVGVVLLVLFAGACVLEVAANRGYNGAVRKLEARMPKDETDPNSKEGTLPSRQEAEALIGKAPDGPLVKDGYDQAATYSWQGLRRKYVLKVIYTTQKEPHAIRIDTN